MSQRKSPSTGAGSSLPLPSLGTWRLDLPYPKPPLSLNDRMHYMKLAKIKAQLKTDVQWLARASKLPRSLPRVRIVLHWQPGSTRPRDSDNPTATLKPLIDGLVAYGLIPDDHSDVCVSECVIEPVSHGRGKTWLTIEQLA